MASESWDVAQARRVGETVKQLRGKRSAQWLSDRTAELGYRVSRSTISEIETARRKTVTTAELTALSWALKVPPVRLLFPELPDGQVDIVPGETHDSITAVMWFSGETTFQPDILAAGWDDKPEADRMSDMQEVRAVTDGAKLVDLARQREDTKADIDRLTALANRMRVSDQPELATTFVDEIAGKQAYLAYLDNELRATPGAVVGDGR